MSATVSTAMLLLVPVFPLLLIGALTVTRVRHMALAMCPLAPLPGLVLALFPAANVSVAMPWLLVGSHWGMDHTGQIFLLLTALLWLAAGIYARSYTRNSPQRLRFWIFFLLCMSGNLGLTLALDMISFYLFFTLMSFAAYGLIIHDNTPFALRAGRIYLWLVILGEVLLFAALLPAARAADSLLLRDVAATLANAEGMNLILALLLVALGIKMGAVPLHFWLPLAHPAAPIPASAVLSGAMIKAGLLGLLRLFPLGFATLPGWSATLLSLGLLMAFFGVLMGLLQKQPKTLLAYSSISQIGFPLMAIGLGLAAPQQWPLLAPVVGFYALHHGLAKGALFLGVGMTGHLNSPGLMRHVTLAGLMLPALALAGAPFTSGALAKAGLKPFLMLSPLLDESLLTLLLGGAAVGTTLLMGRLLLILWSPARAAVKAATSGMWGGWSLLLLAVVLVSSYPGVLTSSAAGADLKWIDALWPVAGGAIITLLGWYSTRKRGAHLGAKDLDVLLDALLRRLANLAAALKLPPPPRLPRGARWQNLPLLLLLQDSEQQLRQLSVAGVMFILLLLALLLL
ncbi:complex I subunit 5 family protein [Pelovirga terrestris]|uniref:NADH/ubiquinone/plastoquinone (Complex I) n=1 Tax=Pelovirga terrestris TaxID=2771352 RepID=A0A8J6QZC9_9BACT|nr:complex I subunit 5 family protein [Pelovirga terrestris]MBD1401217.1 NADH/ubiquinone/plastoquinone (complex I) [Pelovirga terrestris]